MQQELNFWGYDHQNCVYIMWYFGKSDLQYKPNRKNCIQCEGCDAAVSSGCPSLDTYIIHPIYLLCTLMLCALQSDRTFFQSWEITPSIIPSYCCLYLPTRLVVWGEIPVASSHVWTTLWSLNHSNITVQTSVEFNPSATENQRNRLLQTLQTCSYVSFQVLVIFERARHAASEALHISK